MKSIEEIYSVYQKHPKVCTDTRNLEAGCIFFALKGPSFDGNAFASKALEAGAAYVVVDDPKVVSDGKYLLVKDVLTCLQDLARHHRRQFEIPVLAITGSNGKTTSKELIRNVLAKKYNTLATIGNLNNHIGVPLTLLRMDKNTEFAVIEMGANHQGEIASYCNIAEPDFGLITNVGKAHLEGFGGFEGVKKGKGELYVYLGSKGKLVFINEDNEHLKSMAKDRHLTKLYSYGSSVNADCHGTLVAENPGLQIRWTADKAGAEIQAQLTGAYNFENILAAICIGNYFGVSANDINDAISSYIPDNSRSQILQIGNNTVILDAYNANPTSMEAALLNLSKKEGGPRMVCLGQMAELGETGPAEHLRIAELVKKIRPEEVLLVGEKFRQAADTIECKFFEDPEGAVLFLKKHLPSGYTILIKGSRSTKMEKLLEAFK